MYAEYIRRLKRSHGGGIEAFSVVFHYKHTHTFVCITVFLNGVWPKVQVLIHNWFLDEIIYLIVPEWLNLQQ